MLYHVVLLFVFFVCCLLFVLFIPTMCYIMFLFVVFYQDLHMAIKEHRSKELRLKDGLKYLRQELDEAKERKKISMAQKDEYRKSTWC